MRETQAKGYTDIMNKRLNDETMKELTGLTDKEYNKKCKLQGKQLKPQDRLTAVYFKGLLPCKLAVKCHLALKDFEVNIIGETMKDIKEALE